MDRHWNTTITWSKVLWSVKSHDPIATTWSVSPSRKRRSDPPLWQPRRVQKPKFDGASQWSLEDWISTLAQDFNIAWIQTLPDTSCISEQFKDIQERPYIDPELQDHVPSPEGFTECICHVRNASELNSIIRNGVIPGGKSLRRRQMVFSLQWIRWRMEMAWERLHATWRNQGSSHTRILGTAF